MLEHLGERDAASTARAGGRRGDRRGRARHVRPEADARRPDRRRDVRVRGRHHREARADARSSADTKERAVNGRKKVTVVGAGNVGATCALEVARSDYADVVLVDIIPNFPQGKALDMNQAGVGARATSRRSSARTATTETAGSDVVVITAGRPRSPGMSRDDLVTTNEAIVGSVTREIVKRSPKAVLVVVSNPLDAMCHVAKTVSRLPEGAGRRHGGHPRHGAVRRLHRVGDGLVGQGRPGDGARRARRPDGPGRLGDDRRRRAARAAHDRRARSAKMVERTRKGGGELVDLLGTSAWYAPGAAAAQMVDAICLDQKRVLPCTAYLEGEYGDRRPLHGRPRAASAQRGVEEIVKLKLTADGEEDAAGVRGGGARGRRGALERPERRRVAERARRASRPLNRPARLALPRNGSRPQRAHGDRLRRLVGHGSRGRRGARARGCERRHVRAPRATSSSGGRPASARWPSRATSPSPRRPRAARHTRPSTPSAASTCSS